MERISVKSSAVVSVGHEGDVMEVEYAGGRVYRYKGVSGEAFQDLMGSESVGKAIRGLMVGGGFEVEKVEPEPVEWEG
jgi:hypothetical protein